MSELDAIPNDRETIKRPAADLATIVSFLKGWGGPFNLAHMKPDSSPRARHFTDAIEAAVWAASLTESGENIYFHVNPSKRPLTKKATKAYIAALAWLHVDIDPKADEKPDDAKRGALTKLTAFSIQPSAIVDSGGGIQAFWRLASPVPLASPDDAAEVERWNRGLETAFGADDCHNCDRIMRLPGTVNWPNAKKRSKGRIPVETALVYADWTKEFDVSTFPKAPSKGDPSSKRPENVPLDAIPLLTLGDLDCSRVPEADVSRIRGLIVEGIEETSEFEGDKSRAVWFVCCALAKAGVAKEAILGVLLNPKNRISAHILKPQYRGREREYAWRQIERAFAATVEVFELGSNNKPTASVRNVRLALARLGIGLEHDTFAERLLISGLEGFGPTMDDAAATRLWIAIDERFQFRPGKDFFWSVVEDTARLSPRHPVLEYLNSLEWDGSMRVDRWLIDYASADDTPFVRTVGSIILIAAERRVREPGCKFDEMLVLESPQGLGKSTALSVLAVHEDWFADDIPLNGDTKRTIESLAGRWIVEAAELKGMRESKVEHMKAFLSRRVDRALMAYGRLTTEVPCQSVIIGTTNSERYLRDLTGNRRFWPVRIGRFDIEA